MSDLGVSPQQFERFRSALSEHDARHNLCTKCIRQRKGVTVIKVDGKWLHNRKGYVADHDAEPAGKLLGGSRELPPHEEIIVDAFMAPHHTSHREAIE